MKKIVALVAVLFSVVVPVQSQAADEKALVIIDSYFDSRVVNAQIICVEVKLDCSKIMKPTRSFSDNVNHGSAMAEVALRQNSNLKLLLLRTTKSATDVTGADLIRALQWVDNNSAVVGAVSFSRSISNNANKGNCQLSSTGLIASPFATVPAADAEIKRLISSLASKGIPFFASTGNYKSGLTTSVTYPACLPITSSVTANNYTQALYNLDTDFIGSLPEGSLYTTNYKSRISFDGVTFVVPQTTSSATVATAAQYITKGTLAQKVVNVLP